MDLSSIFKTVSSQLTVQKNVLNEADDYNHDHGDNMVQIFDLISNAVSKKSSEPVADQLAYASKVVEKEGQSGSAQLFAKGLAEAASNFTDTELKPDTLGILVKSLLNVKEEEPPKKEKGSLIGSLLSGLTGKKEEAEEAKETEQQKIGVDELLRAGLAY